MMKFDDVSYKQLNLMLHTVGVGFYRNYFSTSEADKDGVEFEKLIVLGLADKSPAPAWSGDGVIYFLTDIGIQFLKMMPAKRRILMEFQNNIHLVNLSGLASAKRISRITCLPYSTVQSALFKMVKDKILVKSGTQYGLPSPTDAPAYA